MVVVELHQVQEMEHQVVHHTEQMAIIQFFQLLHLLLEAVAVVE